MSCSSQAGQLQDRERKRRQRDETGAPLRSLIHLAICSVKHKTSSKRSRTPRLKRQRRLVFLFSMVAPLAKMIRLKERSPPYIFHLPRRRLRSARSTLRRSSRGSLWSRVFGDEALPINLNALKPSADKMGIKIGDYQGLTFVSYHGQALRGGLQLKTTCQVASGLAESEMLRSSRPPLIASLSTLEVMDLATHSARCADQNERWIRPVAELDKGEVRLISRGLNQWGRPELELGPLARNHAPKRFPLFMQAIEAMQSAKLETVNQIKIGQRHFKLADCLRPSHHYDEGCRRLIVP